MGLHEGLVYGTPPISGEGRGTCWGCSGMWNQSAIEQIISIAVVYDLGDTLPVLGEGACHGGVHVVVYDSC